MKQRHGFVLIAVLWFVVGLSAALLDMTIQLRQQRLATVNIADRIRLRAAAEGAAEKAVLYIEQAVERARTDSIPFIAQDLTYTDSIGGIGVTIDLYDAQSRFNPNVAGGEAASSFFSAIGLDGALVSEAVADWIDPDDVDRQGGTETAAYRTAGSLVAPSNRAITDNVDMCGVRGVDRTGCVRMARLVTTLSDGRVNVNTATSDVIMTLPGFTRADSEGLVAARGQLGPVTDLFGFLLSLPGESSRRLQSRWVEIERSSVLTTSAVIAEVHARGAAQLEASQTILVSVANGRTSVSRRFIR